MSLSVVANLAKVWRAFRGILTVLLLVVVGIPTALYVMLASDWAQRKMCDVANRELSVLLDTQVSISQMKFSPFSRLSLYDVTVADDNDSIALRVGEIATRFEFWDFVLHQKIIIDYADVRNLDVSLYRADKSSPLNIDGIIRHLKSDDPNKKPSNFSLRLNDVDFTNCGLTYDVDSMPHTFGKFSPYHIKVDHLNFSLFAPVISTDNYKVWLNNMSFDEHSGFSVKKLSTRVSISQTEIVAQGLQIELPNSLLHFEDISTPIPGLERLKEIKSCVQSEVAVKQGSHVYLPDLKSFVPHLADFPYSIDISLDIEGDADSLNIRRLLLSDADNMVVVGAKGQVFNYLSADSIFLRDFRLSLKSDSTMISDVLRYSALKIPVKTANLLSSLGDTRVSAEVNGTLLSGKAKLAARSGIGYAEILGTYTRVPKYNITDFDANVIMDITGLDLMIPDKGLKIASGEVDVTGHLRGHDVSGSLSGSFDKFSYMGYSYNDINIEASANDRDYDVNLAVIDDNANLHLKAQARWVEHAYSADVDLYVNRLVPDTLNLFKSYPGYSFSGGLKFSGFAEDVDRFKANLSLTNFLFGKPGAKDLRLNSLTVFADNIDSDSIVVKSDYFNGVLQGQYRFSKLPFTLKKIFFSVLPALDDPNAPLSDLESEMPVNEFSFNFEVFNLEPILDFANVKGMMITKAEINGDVNSSSNSLFFKLDVPWILQGQNVIEGTALQITMDGEAATSGVYLTSLIPTKKGDMNVVANIIGENGRLNTDIDWSLKRTIPIKGKIDFTTYFLREQDNSLTTAVDFNPGKINFGDEIWEIRPSHIVYSHGSLDIEHFSLDTGLQSISANGVAGKGPDDRLDVELNNIELINIFETLEIDKALISGLATGHINAVSLLGKEPSITCDNLKVKSIGYNYCELGDANVRLSLDEGGKKFNFDADVTGPMGKMSYINGFIYLPTEQLDLNIKADKVNVGFMRPFMEAFTSSVQGTASGDAHLFGSFKDLDLTGDILVEDLRIKIDFTNTWYSASDSIHLRPGKILIDNIKIKDTYGHTAFLNGWVKHEYFHNASFDFDITKAENFLCYDVTANQSPDWYGRIFGDGSASVKGAPGVVNISASMSTAPNSTFTFVLSDRLDADEYSFITFRDVTPIVAPPAQEDDNIPQAVKERWAKKKVQEAQVPTAYNMDITVDVKPSATLVIVMDPAGGDRIDAHGSGNLRMTYGSIDNDMKLFGTYTLNSGTYDFTFQDVIRKTFNIKEGSSIFFPGDPYKAELNLNAYFQIIGKLTDLDESFATEMNNTDIPIRALLKVSGLMLQPDIDFDLEFPTLTSDDVYRKVKSIVSTEDMMARQIMYILALNRLYTPEYMASTTKGSELFSVASSTISSQISNMLGKLSDNWSIAPNLRSDRGDFSDLEVDISLSSSLLNNRLLFNGNFGYRDKSLNTNQFIGDFDVEYLLNKSGVWRLKAYNRYNDQNYYLRTAQTTQGVGILYRKEFDRPFRFLDKFFRRRKDADVSSPDSVPVSQGGLPASEAMPDTALILYRAVSDTIPVK